MTDYSITDDVIMWRYYDKENNKTIEVQLEPWAWKAVYKDGSELLQFDDQGVFHRFTEIDFDKLHILVMYQTGDGCKQHSLVKEPGMQVFHFYRNIRPWYLQCFVRVYAFGYKKDGVAHYNFILPDDRVIRTTKQNIDLTTFELMERS